MAVKVELFDDLAAVERDAAGALDRDARPSLFDRLDWFQLTLAHCPPPGRPLVARAEDGAARAWLFLMVARNQARALASWYSLAFDGIGDPALFVAIARALKARLATVELAPLSQSSPLPAAFRTAGWLTRRTPATVNWIADTADQDFEQYWSRRPGQLRNTARRRARAAGLDVAIHRSFDPNAWAQYEAVYAASWKPAEGSPAFLRALAEQEGAAGTLRLGIASRDGEPLAAQLWLVENGVATIHKLAYDEAARPLSPGTVLSMAMFRDVIERDRPRLIDFGTGDDGYKADWMDAKRPLWRLEAWNPASPRGLAGAARARIAALVRRRPSD